ncbi:MAG: hypothetical protein ACKVP0_15040 [Pirellulaceae bacterium]
MSRLSPLRLIAIALAVLVSQMPSAIRAEPTVEEKQVASDYLQAIFDARAKLHDAGFKLGQVIGPLVREGKDIDIADAEAKYAVMKSVIVEIKKSHAAKKVPSGETGTGIDNAWKAFIKVQTRVVDIEMAAVIAVLDDKELDNDGKKAQILKLIDRIVAKEKKDSEGLLTAQEALKAAFDIKVEAPK